MGIISQLTNLNNLITTFGTLGLPIGLTKYVSQWESEDRWDEIYSLLSLVFIIFLSIGITGIVIALIFSQNISQLILNTNEYYKYVLILFFSFPFIFVTSIFDAYLRGLKKFDHYVKINVRIIFTSFGINIIMIYFFGLSGFVYSILINSILTFFIFLRYLIKKELFVVTKLFKTKIYDKIASNKIMLLGLGSLIIGVVQQLSFLFLRSKMISSYGLDANGLYQSVYLISNNYFSVFFMAVGIYALPVISENLEINKVNNIINDHFRLVFILIVPLVCVFFVFRDIILQVLFSKSFLNASNLFFFNFLGDYFKALAWVSGLWLIPNMKVRAWVIFDLILNGNFIIFFFIMSYAFNFGLISITISYFISNFIHFLLNLWYVKRKHSFHFEKRSSLLFFYSSSTLILVMLISEFNKFIGYFAIFPILSVWILLSFNKDDFLKAKNMITEKYKSLKKTDDDT